MTALETRFCTLCGPQAPKRVKFPANFSEGDLNPEIFSARRQPDRKHFQLVECETYGIIFSDPACPPSELSGLYEQSTVNYDRQEEQIFDSYAPLLERALPWLTSRGTFLEIGGGRGFMLRWGAQQGFLKQVEVEPSEDAEKRFTPWSSGASFVRGIFQKGMLESGSVSLACFFQMLDHVPDPAGFLRAVYDVLEPGGVVVCATHDTSALSARLLGEKSPIYDIEHTYLFNRHNLPRLFREAGFGRTDAFAFSNRYAVRYWLRLAPMPAPLKKLSEPVLEHLHLAGVRVPLRAGNFAVIAQKERV